MRCAPVHFIASVGIASLAVMAALGSSAAVRFSNRHDADEKDIPLGFRKEPLEVRDDNPLAAQEWRAMAWKDANGNIDPNGLSRALDQRAAMIESDRQPMLNGSIQWTNLGPTGISGRGRSILFDPTDPNVIIEGSVGGGIWKSTDKGQTFHAVDDSMACLAIGSMARDPNNPETLYAGTGEGTHNIDELAGKGLFKSTDGGNTWKQMPNAASIGWMNRIAVAPSNSNVVLIAGTGGLHGPGGIYRSTNGGQSFTPVLSFATGTGEGVMFNPADGTKAVAVTWQYGSNPPTTEGYTASFSTDGGQTWTAANAPFAFNDGGFYGRIELAYAPSNPSIIYALNGNDGAIYKSVDGGQNYAKVTTAGQVYFSSQAWYDNCLWVSPTDPNLIVAAGVTIWRSTDGGQTLTDIGDGYNGSGLQPHPDIHELVSDPWYDGQTDTALYVYTDGGTFKTNNILTVQYNPSSGPSGWLQLDSAVTTQFYSIAGDGPSQIVIGGTQDNGTEQVINSGNGGYIFGGDGGYVAMDPTNPLYEYGEYVDLYMFRSTDGTGNTSNWIYNGISDAGGNANFIAPFILDPNDPNKLWAGGGNLWLSTNAKASTPTWTNVRPQDSGANPLLSAIAVAPGNSNIVWIGENDGTVSMSQNALSTTPTWTTVNNNFGGTPQFNRMITRIYIDPANSNLVYVCMGGFTPDNIWKTTNGGTTWRSLTGSGLTGLPQAPVRGFTRDPLNPLSLFAGTEVGVFWSQDGGQTWTTNNTMPATASVDEITFENNSHVLLAGTHGRGMWAATFAPIQFGFASPTMYSSGTIVGTVQLTFPAPAGGLVVSLTNSNPAALKTPASVTVPAGASSVTFKATAPVVLKTLTDTVAAGYKGYSIPVSLSVAPVGLTKLALSTTSVVGGSATSLTGTVTVDSAAPSGGSVVNLTSSNPAVVVPSTVTVPSGAKTATFSMTDVPVAATTAVTITATRGTAVFAEVVNVANPTPTSLSLSPSTVVGQLPVSATLTLNAPAARGFAVSLASSNSHVATAPSSVTFSAGSKTATFAIATSPVDSSTPVTFSATVGTVTKTASLTVKPATLLSMVLSPTSAQGSSSTVVTLTINLNAKAGPSGCVVTLSSSNAAAAAPPASVVIPAGKTVATVAVRHQAVSATTTVKLTGALNGSSASASLKVTH